MPVRFRSSALQEDYVALGWRCLCLLPNLWFWCFIPIYRQVSLLIIEHIIDNQSAHFFLLTFFYCLFSKLLLFFRFLFLSIQCHWLSAMPVPHSWLSESGVWQTNWPMHLPRYLCNGTDMWTLQRTSFWIWLFHREVSVFFVVQLKHPLCFCHSSLFYIFSDKK